MNRKDVYIHPASYVSDNAIIGSGTKIWINSQIREGVSIGDHCIISKDTYIDHNVQIGSGVKIQNGVSVYHGVTIEDNVFIGPNVVFTNDFYPRAYNQEWKIVPTLIKKCASIGANATIVCGITVGEYALIGAGSVVNKDVIPHALMVGNPAKLIGYVCVCGHKLDKNMKCLECGKILKERIYD